MVALFLTLALGQAPVDPAQQQVQQQREWLVARLSQDMLSSGKYDAAKLEQATAQLDRMSPTQVTALIDYYQRISQSQQQREWLVARLSQDMLSSGKYDAAKLEQATAQLDRMSPTQVTALIDYYQRISQSQQQALGQATAELNQAEALRNQLRGELAARTRPPFALGASFGAPLAPYAGLGFGYGPQGLGYGGLNLGFGGYGAGYGGFGGYGAGFGGYGLGGGYGPGFGGIGFGYGAPPYAPGFGPGMAGYGVPGAGMW